MKRKLRKIFKRKLYWLSVAVVGLVVGITLQFVRAATPTGPAPAGSAYAPLTTSSGTQKKDGNLQIGGSLDVGDVANFSQNVYMKSGKSLYVDRICFGTLGSIDCINSFSGLGGGSGSSYTPGEWFNDKLTINYNQKDPDGSWATVQETSFVAGHAINKVRIRGYSNDGGYCYAYWDTGHFQIYRHDPNVGIYNVDNQWYDGAPIYEPPTYTYNSGSGYIPTCSKGTLTSDVYCDTTTDGTICSPGCLTGYNNCPSGGAFSDNGQVKICQINWSAGTIPTGIKDVNIPEGANVKLQGRHTIGSGDDGISCALDIQYAP